MPEPARPAPPAPSPDAQTLAARLVQAGAEAPPGLDDAGRTELAWALKQLAYDAWHADPARAVAAAQALRGLTQAAAAGSTVETTVQALADWTEAIALLTRGDMAPALDALDRSRALWLRLERPLEAAQTQVPKIMALTVLGRFDAAQDCALAAREALRAAGDTAAAARVSLNLGSLAIHRTRFAEALAPYREAAVLFARAGDRNHSVMADIGLADACTMLGRIDEARSLFERARLRAEAHALPMLAASATDGLATLALSCGRHAEALAGFEAARSAYESLDLPQLHAEAEKSLADAYLEVRLLPEAIAIYHALVRTLEAQEAGATLPWTLAQLGRAQALAGRHDEALATLRQADEAFEAQEITLGRALVALAESELRLAAGDADLADRRAAEAAAAFEAEGVRHGLAQARVQQAATAVACGRATDALGLCETLLASAQLPAPLRVRAEVERAAAWRLLGRRDEACTALERAIDDFELLHAALPGDDLRRAFLADGTRPYVERLRFALEAHEAVAAGDDAGAGDAAATVLHWLERLKDRALGERLGRPAAAQDDEPPHDVALRARLDAIHRRRQRLAEEEDAEGAQALADEAWTIEQALLEQARRRRLRAPPARAPGATAGSAAAEGASEVVDSEVVDAGARAAKGPAAARAFVARLQAALGPQAALVEYGVLDDELFALVVRAERIHLVRRLAPWSAVLGAVRALRFQIETLRAGVATLAAHVAQLVLRAEARLGALHALLWQPFAALLEGSEQVVVVPHGALHGIPFGALRDAEGVLVERHEIGLAANAAAALAGLAPAPQASADEGLALLVGDGTGLANVEGEMVAVVQALALAQRVHDLEALRERAPAAALLHLAGHAQFRADSPLYSALLLHGSRLTAAEVERLRLRARLVVLSACETALGDTGGAGDASIGLVRAFLMAGAERVLGSLWAVDDAATADFMRSFYGHWRGGARPARALRLAQLATRAIHPHPAHWAAFSLHGGL